MGVLYANQVAATLAGQVSPAATGMALSMAQGSTALPTAGGGDFFYLTLIDQASYAGQVSPPAQREIVKVTANSGTTITAMERGQDGTTPQQWTQGDRVELRLNALSLRQAGATYDATYRAVYTPNNTYDIAAGVVAATLQFNGSIAASGTQENEIISFRSVTSTLTGPSATSAMISFDHNANVPTGCSAYGMIGQTRGMSGSGKIDACYARVSVDGTFNGIAAAATFAGTMATGAPTGQSALIDLEFDGVGTWPIGVQVRSNSPLTAGLSNGFVIHNTVNLGASAFQWNQFTGGSSAYFLVMLDPASILLYGVDAAGTITARALNLTLLPPIHANNAAATGAGMTAGQTYRTGADPDVLCVVH